MYKRLLKTFTYHRFLTNYPKLKLGSFVVVILCVFLIMMGTFTQLHLTQFNIIPQFISISSINNIHNQTNIFYYIPQIPIVLFITAFIGPRLGFFSVFIYILVGLIGFPVFASGGGIHYVTQHGFGYIIGFLLGVILSGRILAGKYSIYKVIRATIVGVLCIHIFGIAYLTVLLLIKEGNIVTILNWIYTLTVKQLPYDLLFSSLTISLGLPARGIFWIAMD